MEENTTELNDEVITEDDLNEQDCVTVDLNQEFRIQYRLLRKKWSAFIRKKLKKNFANILYVTAEELPIDFILSMQKQYPDKIIKLLVPIYNISKGFEKTNLGFDYFIQNDTFSAEIYRIPSGHDNIQIYGAYTEGFEGIQCKSDIYNIKYLSHLAKIARKTALKLKPDIVHSDNIPLLLGLEFGNRWKSGYTQKFVQTVHNVNVFNNIEPFWAAINLVNKKEMQRIISDNEIKKNIAALFNIKSIKNFTKLNDCLEYLYKNYDNYREKVKLGDDTNENILLNRLNARIIKMFPWAVQRDESFYNPIFYSMKRASGRVFNSKPDKKPKWLENINEYCFVLKKYENTFEYKIKHSFELSNFREVRNLNKKYLVRELSEKRIETQFVDINLFESEEVNISGYLDSFYKAPLVIIPFNESVKEADIKTVSVAILKLFELKKNVQVIYNYPKNLNSGYLKTLFEFFESQPALKGRWIAIEGKINLGQFLSAADMILIPSGECLNVEKTLYLAMKYGCIPIVNSCGICGEVVADIYDDMTQGCGFKAKPSKNSSDNELEQDEEVYTNTVIRGLKFYNENPPSWNVLIENAMNYNVNWDFKTLESYNDLYEDII